MNEDNLNIVISGTAIYKAVKNYLKDNAVLTSLVDAQVAKLAADGTLEHMARTKIDQQLTSYYVKDAITKSLSKAINDGLKGQIETLVAAAIKKRLEGFIILMPNS